MLINLYGDVEDVVNTTEQPYDELVQEMYSQLLYEGTGVIPCYHVIAANVEAGLPGDYEPTDPDECRLYFEGSASKLIHDRPGEPQQDEVMVIYIAKDHIKRAVIETHDDILIAQELEQQRQ